MVGIDELTKELQKHLNEGESASDILKRIKESKQAQKQPTGKIPTPPPLPNQEETQKKGWNWKFWRKEEKKKIELTEKEQIKEDLKRDIKNLSKEDLETNFITLYGVMEQLQQEKDNWELNTATFKETIEKLTDNIEELREENKELKRKLNLEPLRPQPRNMPIMNEKDVKIIEQVKAHLEPLTNAKTLRERILKAETENTKDAYWELHKDLTSAGLYLDKLIQFFQQDMDEVHAFTHALGATLRGEYLNEN